MNGIISLGNIPGFELPKQKVASVKGSVRFKEENKQSEPEVLEPTGEIPTQGDIQTLSGMIKQWRELKLQMRTLEESISEKKKHFKVLDTVIMRQMKRFNIGALDLQSSGGRVRYDKKKVVAGINPKSLEQMLKEYLKSDEEAKKLLDFIQEHREIRLRESLKYEDE